jgi:hypothetical protein
MATIAIATQSQKQTKGKGAGRVRGGTSLDRSGDDPAADAIAVNRMKVVNASTKALSSLSTEQVQKIYDRMNPKPALPAWLQITLIWMTWLFGGKWEGCCSLRS